MRAGRVLRGSALPRLARSAFILRSPRRVSRKREFSWIRLETFGNVRPKKFEHPSPETFGDEKSPRLAGLSHQKKEILRTPHCLAGAGGFEPVDGKSLVRQVREPSSLKTDYAPSSHATSDRESFATGRNRPAQAESPDVCIL